MAPSLPKMASKRRCVLPMLIRNEDMKIAGELGKNAGKCLITLA